MPPLHLVPIRILSRHLGVGCLLKSVFGLPLIYRILDPKCGTQSPGRGVNAVSQRALIAVATMLYGFLLEILIMVGIAH